MECVIEMPREMVASIVVQDLQVMREWGCVDANIQCIIASKNEVNTMI